MREKPHNLGQTEEPDLTSPVYTCDTAYKTCRVEWPSVNQLEVRTTKKDPKIIKTQDIHRANINNIPRALCSGHEENALLNLTVVLL